MKKRRIIPRFDVKGPNVVKGICLEGLRVVGKPAEFARKYYEQGADEIVYIDIVASLYERNNLIEVIEEAASLGISIPLTVGGGIRSLDDITKILRAGADKVAINTAATRNPELIQTAARRFGSQCIVGSIQAKQQGPGKWEAYIDNGRQRTGLDAIDWAKQLVELGTGELLVTSVDREGTLKGYDTDLIKQIVSSVDVPVIACGGAGSIEDVGDCFLETGCDAVALASILHYDKTTIGSIKSALSKQEIQIRQMKDESHLRINGHSKREVTIIDYGLGNLLSVTKAFEVLGNPVRITSHPEEIQNSELLVLPGVGAFADGMAGLRERGLIEPIKEYVQRGSPMLGICLGMQLLMTESEEFGRHKGLNLIEGQVTAFKPKSQVSQEHYRVPHVGWNVMSRPNGVTWNQTILENTPEESDVYFVHSFIAQPSDQRHVLATSSYGRQKFAATIKKGNVYGTQYHPEKSGITGMEMLYQFCTQPENSFATR